ncbi:MAG: hypothetical protein ACRYGR_10350 [Janthinobacterium lividum]
MDGTIFLARDGVILPEQVTLGCATDTAQECFKSSNLGVGINVFTKTPYLNYNQSQNLLDQQIYLNRVIVKYILF